MKNNPKLRVLIVADYFYPHWTGICKSMFYMLKLISHRYNISILTVRYQNDLKNKEKLFNSTIYRVNYQFTLSRAKYSFNMIWQFLQMIKNYDIVLINSPCTNILPLCVIAKLFHKKLLILHQADFILPKSIINNIFVIIYRIMSILGFALADKVSSWNKDFAKNSDVLKPFIHKFFRIPLPIILAKPNYSKNIDNLKTLKKKGNILLGFAGRFVEEKGFDILLQAIPIVEEKLPNTYFVYAGTINLFYENFFEKNRHKYEEVKKYIINVGLLDDAKLAAYYKIIDLIIVPSRTDAFPLVQAEATYSGTPSVTSDIPGARYLYHQTKFGLLFESENPKDLAQKIIEALNKKKEIMKNYPKVKNFFDNKNNAEIIYQFIEE